MQVLGFRFLSIKSLSFAIVVAIGCGGSDHPADVSGELPLDDATDTIAPALDSNADTDTACTPSCGNRVCGPDPVCRESCGTCTYGETCNSDGQCVAGGCVKDCSGRECGPDPVCEESCGTCTDGKTCNSDGQCVTDGCVQDCSERDCGLDPVCGEPCGSCGVGAICGTNGKCFTPTEDCNNGWCLIPSGTFLMGSPDDEPERDSHEGPVHSVTITRSFYMKQTEVTQGEWDLLIDNSPYYFDSCGADCPIEWVNWYEAVYYANALSESEDLETCYSLEGCSGTAGSESYSGRLNGCSVTFKGVACKGYRLPTEAEWEYAARAGTSGPRYGDLEEIAWHKDNSFGTIHPVATKTANAWGLNDMIGNLFEWVNDWFASDYYSTCDSGCDDPPGPDEGSKRVERGGSWYYLEKEARAAYRDKGDPAYRSRDLGFRLVRTVP